MKDAPVVKLLDKFDAAYTMIDNDGPIFWFQTDLNASRGKIIAIDVRKPEPVNWKVIVPEAAETLQGVSFVNNMFVANYLKDAHTQVKIFDKSGKFVREVEFAGIGSAGGFGGRATN